MKKAFTLIELLVVIAIIAILAGMLVTAFNNAYNASRRHSIKHQTPVYEIQPANPDANRK